MEVFIESTPADEYESLSSATNEALDYAAGDVCKKLHEKSSCDSCRGHIEANNSEDKASEGQSTRVFLAYPLESFLKCFKTLVIHGEDMCL